jgi:hypothetical protein
MSANRVVVACALAAALAGCGLFVPEKYPLTPDTINPDDTSAYGNLENAVIDHVQCEIAKGIWRVAHSQLKHVAWLYHSDWGTSATLTLTFEDESGLTPNATFTTPLANWTHAFSNGTVSIAQSTSLAVGASGTANSTRTETIQFTYTNKDLLYWANAQLASDPNTCEKTNQGILIHSDLKIDQFIYDKMTIAALGNDIGRVNRDWPPFNTFQEQITFVAAYGGSVTPTWKFARTAVDPAGTLLSATRTDTDSLTVTLGEVTPAKPTSPAQLKSSGAGATLHTTGVQATQNGTQGKATAPQ